MLILSRHAAERIVIGHDVVLTIVQIRGDLVRIGIDAPHHVSVHREEIYKELYPQQHGMLKHVTEEIAKQFENTNRQAETGNDDIGRISRDDGPAKQ